MKLADYRWCAAVIIIDDANTSTVIYDNTRTMVDKIKSTNKHKISNKNYIST